MPRLPINDPLCPFDLSVADGVHPQYFHGAADRRQRVAQLVTEHCQELILALIHVLQGLLDRTVGTRLLERRPDSVSHALHESDFRFAPVARPGLHDRQHRDQHSASQQRRGYQRTDALQSEPAVIEKGRAALIPHVAHDRDMALPRLHCQSFERPQRQAGDFDLRSIACALTQHDRLSLRLVELHQRDERGSEALAQAVHCSAHQLLRVAHRGELRGQRQQECTAIVRFFGFMHVRGRAHPPRDLSAAVANRLRTAQMPAESAVEAPESSLEVQRVAAAHRVAPSHPGPLLVLRMRGRATEEHAL